jgi:hypothetical protein
VPTVALIPQDTTVYIAGPMRGIKNFNREAFDAAEHRLIELEYTPYSPVFADILHYGEEVMVSPSGDLVDILHTGFDYRETIGLAINIVASKVDAVCVLPGWQNSKGARLEVEVAKHVGIPIMCLTEEGLVPRVRAIGLSGYARSGKDTVAGLLAPRYTRVAFADILREFLLRLDPLVLHDASGDWTVEQLLRVHKGDWEAIKPMGIRPLLQRLGTDAGRALLGDTVWIDAALDRVPDGSKIVVTDCRFPNEAQAIKDLGGEVWRVDREGYGPINAHPSESAMDDWDFDVRLTNNSTLIELADQVRRHEEAAS